MERRLDKVKFWKPQISEVIPFTMQTGIFLYPHHTMGGRYVRASSPDDDLFKFMVRHQRRGETEARADDTADQGSTLSVHWG